MNVSTAGRTTRTHNVDDIHEALEQRNVLVAELLEIVVIHVRGKVCVRHISAGMLQFFNGGFLRLQKVDGHEFDARIDPVIRKRPAR